MRFSVTAAALLVLPLVVYWATVSHEFGFRDDYAHLREVRERPGWLTSLTTSNGRPIYGAVLEASLRDVYVVSELSALRLTSAVLFGAVGVLLWLLLRRSGWGEAEAAAVGAAVTLLPGAQIIVGWAIAWPIALGVVAALLAFMAVERGVHSAGVRRASYVAAGFVLYLVAGFTYQTSALFAVVPLAAVLLLRPAASLRSDAYWVAAHVGVLLGGLVAGFAAMNVVFVEGVVAEAARMTIEPHPFTKLLWFVRNPLPNSVALFALRDRFATPVSFWLAVAAVAAVVVLGFVHGARSREARWRWLFAALLLPFVAHSVSLAASSQAIGYRTLLPLSGLFVVLAAYGLRSVAERYRAPRALTGSVLAAVIVAGAGLAQRNAFALIAQPQGLEWQLVKAAANRVTLDADTSVYLIRPSIAYRATARLYADEHGSLTSDADWAAKEMFKAAMRERFPDGLPQGKSYSLLTAFGPPPPQYPYDFVVDLRELVNLGERAMIESGATASQR
jgi:hypothetical protein